jgi:hypothetical protein
MTKAARPPWLLLILSLPTESATARMRIWRALKTLGCAALRDGAYLLPATAEHEAALRNLADECSREGGTAVTLTASAVDERESDAFPLLFDRAEDYAALVKAWKKLTPGLTKLGASDLARLRKKLRRDYDAVRAIDFFPGEASTSAEAAWGELTARIERLLSPDEPRETRGDVPRRKPNDYQGRLWATRRRIWVDRVASAWLIRRFIDKNARFTWLARPSDCPRKAVGFDFDGAAFTHVGDRVTFETLTASFGLDDDPALARLGAMVRSLDVGGDSVPEGAGFEAVLTGARERLADDGALLDEMSGVLDSLYTHFARDAR